MTEQIKKAYRITFVLAALVALGLTLLRSYAVIRFYDLDSRYFELGQPLPDLVHALTLLAIPFAIFVPLALGKGKLSAVPARFHLPTAFTAALVAFLLIAFAVLHVSDIADLLLSDKPINFRPFTSLVVSVISAAIGSISFVLSASFASEVSAKKAFTSLAVAVFAAFYATILYFDRTVNYNDPQYVLGEMTLLSISLFFLYETRIALAHPKPAVRVGLGMLAMILSFSSSIPNLLFYLINGRAVFDTPMHDFLILAFALYILARLSALAETEKRSRAAFFSDALAAEEESVSSVGQISFFSDDAAPAPGDASALLSSKLREASEDPESEEAKNLFSAPEESTPPIGSPEGDLLDPLASDLLGPISESEDNK